ncbi:MAG TPA: isoamylase early set domain-containing protein [Prolixibacteraceae bacterium]|nr:glycoside hydrolase [Bacteroidales bacterium]HNQ37293.1 isoamylase early set domain-containing protein [Prolixibacteraceae bacterium]HPJ79732.1 isoamylase early set domain-containing protein [Prolixibacteraceae bacterium]HRV88895.1 isoamylase early set domain-containing protein [Prolixibacteraceae bacterium]
MSIKKQFLKTKPVCKVSFKLSNEQVSGASKVNIAGDFNNWNETSDEMNTLKDGSFSLTLDLETGREYQFRYLLDGSTWINDEAADNYCPSGFGDSQNSVIVL